MTLLALLDSEAVELFLLGICLRSFKSGVDVCYVEVAHSQVDV